jgi:uracil-DNA glycosylase
VSSHPAETARSVPDLVQLVAGCRLCGTAVTPPPILWAREGQRALIIGQAPGAVEVDLALPFQGRAGARLRQWLEPAGAGTMDGFLERFAVAAVLKCYPGPSPGGRGDRVPTRTELAHCRPWTEAALRLLDPVLVVPVGRLALAEWLPARPLDELVGRRFEVDGRAVIPLPHPSGASSWANAAANRALIQQAVALIVEELARVPFGV